VVAYGDTMGLGEEHVLWEDFATPEYLFRMEDLAHEWFEAHYEAVHPKATKRLSQRRRDLAQRRVEECARRMSAYFERSSPSVGSGDAA
jgi:hypothetical protein